MVVQEPTTVVPFFGDQPFWGDRVHARGVGPAPIPVDEFSLEKLVSAIQFMLDPKVKERATELAKAMENEDGATGAVKAFYKHFPLDNATPKSQRRLNARPNKTSRCPNTCCVSMLRCFSHSSDSENESRQPS
ncbi:unnamed protein product [Cuscuta campestris]|uniref:Glycosyl transferase family 28 C-terminal domain-containing protein n=1 Tax=Cuscuta campestris TaxID=132261 RepID=A0A484LQR7_9ASTE|nr:unnamed protein product [Cuscuta campestris]